MRAARWVASFVLAALVLLLARSASAEPVRILVAAGRAQGRTGERPLRFADDDAKSVRDVFVRLGGVSPAHALLAQHATADDVLHSIDAAAHLSAGHPRDEVAVIFYFSGHADRAAIHLGEERLPIEEIQSRLRAVNAALRIVVLDACRTNDGRAKGFSDAEPFAVALPDGGAARGTVLLHASADGEVAQESDELGGAVFTHYWVNGLLGAADANDDGQVTLGEAYAYAYQQTLWRTAISSGVEQRPSAIVDLQEAAPLVLSRTTRTSAIRFPVAADVHYVVYALGSQTVVGDLWGTAERGKTLALKPGRYIVHRRGGGQSSAAEIALARDAVVELSPSAFRPVPEEAISLKGGAVVLRPDELGAGYTVQSTSRIVAFGQEGELRYTHLWDGWGLGGALHGGTGTLDSSAWHSTVAWLGADALGERRWALGWPTLRLGVGVTFDYVFQTLRRADAAALAGTPYATPDQTARSILAGGRLVVGLRLPVSPAAWLDVEGRGDVLGTELGGAAAAVVRASARAGVGMAF
jgi:hypothetical protein